MKNSVVLASLFLFSPLAAQAQSTDPVDRNNAGPFAGLGLNLGQAHGVGADSNGLAYLLSADIGYVMKRDTWNRIELGLELSTGKAEFGTEINGIDLDYDVDITLAAMLKAGYGYSMGDHAFGIFRAGFGIANAEAEAKAGGTSFDFGDASGTVAMVGYDVVFPASDTLDFLVGANYRILNLNFDDIQGQSGDLQINIPAIAGAARIRF